MSDQASKRAALLVAVGGSFLNPFMGSAINIALPAIGREFAMDAVLLGWVATAFLLTAAMCLLPFGRLADIHGRKRVYTWGVAIFTLCSAACALAPSSGWLMGGRALQGLGSALMFGTGMAILASVYPPEERGRVLGINVAAVYLGLSLGPVVGGLLTQHLGWRSVFWINVPLGAGILTCVFWKLKGEWAGARGEGFDVGGTLLYGLSLVAFIYGATRLPAPAGIWPVALGGLGLVAFVLWEQRVGFPLLNIGLFRNNLAFACSNLAALVNYSATSAVGFLLSLYLQYVRGLSPQSAGLVMMAQPLVMAACSPLAGRLSDRVEPRTVASVGMGLTVAGLGLLTALDAQTSWAYLVGTLLTLGLGFALFSSPNANAVMSSVEQRFYGVASAFLGTMRLTGNMLSMGVAMAILGASMGRVQITPEHQEGFLGSLHLIFTIFAVLCVGGILASLARGKIPMNTIQGLIFDCDGVLVDSEKFSCGAWVPVLRRRGIEVELSDIEAFIGQSDKAVLAHYRARGAEFPPDILAEREQEYFDLARGRLQSFPGLKEALEQLRERRFPVAVASSGELAKIRFSLSEVGLLEFFPILCSAAEVQRGKPAPDLFLLAARRLGLAPEACAVVEDAVPGLQAARAAGMKAIGFPSSHPKAVLREAGAQVVLSSYSELLSQLE